jgi:prolyl 4-hydroxylase
MLINKNPRIQTIKKFISNNFCDKLIELYNSDLVRSYVVDNNENVINPERTSKSKILDNEDKDLKKIIHKISEIVNLDPKNCEPVVFTKYKENEEYKPHFDGFINPSENNQRIYTAILYLSECLGGETFFDKLNIKINAVKGSICLFENCINDTDHINPGSLHSGLKVKSGEKIIMTFWFRRHNF